MFCKGEHSRPCLIGIAAAVISKLCNAQSLGSIWLLQVLHVWWHCRALFLRRPKDKLEKPGASLFSQSIGQHLAGLLCSWHFHELLDLRQRLAQPGLHLLWYPAHITERQTTRQLRALQARPVSKQYCFMPSRSCENSKSGSTF